MLSSMISKLARIAVFVAVGGLTGLSDAASLGIRSSNAGTNQNVRLLPRVSPNTKQLSWPGTGFAYTFTGTQTTVNFLTSTGTNSVTMLIDGTQTVYKGVTTGNISSPILSSGTHNVVVYHRSETAYGTLTFGGVYANTGGTIGAIPAGPARRIEFIGDSITVGYGEGGTYPCTNTADVEDAPNTYGAMTARTFGADFSLVAWSGKGLLRNIATASNDTSPLMPELWTRYGANDADNSYTFPSAYVPQAVVINLGTNDWTYLAPNSSGQVSQVRPRIDPKAFTAAYVNFIKTIMSHYSGAHFFLCSSPMLSDSYPSTADAQHTTQVNAIKAAVSQLNTPLVQFVDFPTEQIGSTLNGCDGHPSPSGHQAMTNILTPAIKSALNW